MAQESVAPEAQHSAQHNADEHGGKGTLGPLLCWAVVFADIGTSVYYTPGILYLSVQGLAGFFVFLTMSVFILLTLKYAEVTHRFPQGGGVVTVAAQALNPWFGALGGMFILVDYFLTAAISSLSGILYLSVVVPAMGPPLATWITAGILILLGILNWVGISESARVSLVGAIIAFISDIAILITVFSHLSLGAFFALFPKMFSGHALTPFSLLAGFAGSFLAFSGLESISQLSPVMKQPHKKVAGMALLLVVLTIGLTSPLLTMFSTLLLPKQAADPVESAQIISLLAGHWGSTFLQTEVAISAGALLIFASNTAIIGAYHVFMALSRMGFLPEVILQRNRLRDTPHYSIALATGIPIVILIIVNGRIDILGDMYAFGLLGAFSLTCLGLDIVRYRELRRARADRSSTGETREGQAVAVTQQSQQAVDIHDLLKSNVEVPPALAQSNGRKARAAARAAQTEEARTLWFRIKFILGIVTTLLVTIAWSTNLVTKPLATAFGGGVTVVGMILAYINLARHQRAGRVPVPVVATRLEDHIPSTILAVLSQSNAHNDAVIRAAVNNADQNDSILFLYLSEHKPRPESPRMMEIVDPYLEDAQAKESFGKAENLALKASIPIRRYIYVQEEPGIVSDVWHAVHPNDMVLSPEYGEQLKDVNPDRVRYELTSDGKVTHMLKRWQREGTAVA